MSTLFGRPCAHWAPRLLSSLAGLARIMGHPRVFGVWQTVRGSQGTCAPMLFGGPCAHWAPRLLFGLACRAWNLRQGRCAKLCAGNGAIVPVWCALPPARPSGARVFWEVWQQRWIKGYARKYSMFLQHLHVLMCLSMRVTVVDFNVSGTALENTQKRFEKQSDSSSSYTNCNVFL